MSRDVIIRGFRNLPVSGLTKEEETAVKYIAQWIRAQEVNPAQGSAVLMDKPSDTKYSRSCGQD
jgi:hypothetical protein